MTELEGSCACKRSHFSLTRKPTRRFLCHCEICQSVYNKPYADVFIANARTTVVAPESPLDYRHLNGAKSIDRGICEQCGEPTIGFLKLMPGIRLAFIPAHTLRNVSALPPPEMHIFYESRAARVPDDLPKYDTPGQSMRACLWPFMAGFAGF